MSETRPSRILDVSSSTENSEQQYVEIGSNIYLGTKDGIKYCLIKTSDNKFHLVEAPSDSSISLDDSNGFIETLQDYENSSVSNITLAESSNELKEIKISSIKSESSPCKGQGDEIGNTVISPRSFTPSFKKLDYTVVEKVKQEPTPKHLSSNSLLTYTTLYPKQEKNQLVTHYVSPPSTYPNYSPTFPSPVAIRRPRYTRRPRGARMPFMPPRSPYTPIPRVRRGTSRMRRPKYPMYQYTPQILHSTPTNLTSANYSNESSLSLSGSSSGSVSGSSLSVSNSSIEYPRVPNNTPTSPEAETSGSQKVFSLQWMPFIEDYVSLNPREAHNEKERHRRLRIKNACHAMRNFMPWLDEKTDNATVFEEVVNYIVYMKGTVGLEFDVEFMEQNYIY